MFAMLLKSYLPTILSSHFNILWGFLVIKKKSKLLLKVKRVVSMILNFRKL